MHTCNFYSLLFFCQIFLFVVQKQRKKLAEKYLLYFLCIHVIKQVVFFFFEICFGKFGGKMLPYYKTI